MKSQRKQTQAEMIQTLKELGGGYTSTDDVTFEGSKYILPENPRTSLQDGVDFLEAKIREQESPFSFKKVFEYMPHDMAYAFQQVAADCFGGMIGKATQSMFGTKPPEMIEINISHDETVSVPWGVIQIPALGSDTQIYLSSENMGNVLRGYVVVEGQKKNESAIKGLFALVEAYLRENSIYRGKAITIDQYGWATFLDPYTVDRNKVVYSKQTLLDLEANLWVDLEHTQELRDMGQTLKRTILLEGPYGTGKTICGTLTAQICVENGWTYIVGKPGGASLSANLETARLYQPCVVMTEDIDVQSQYGRNSGTSLSKLLDVFDGFDTKNTEIIVLATTNHPDRIPKGMLRPGRINSIIHVGGLDDAGIRKLAEVTIPDHMMNPDEIDWVEVCKAFEGYLPAFAVEAFGTTLRRSLSRGDGSRVSTEDLVAAAGGLRSQERLMIAAEEGLSVQQPLDLVLGDIVRTQVNEQLNNVSVRDYDGDEAYTLEV